MSGQDFTTTFTVDQSPADVFAAINNVRGWWSTVIVGETSTSGDTFTFEVPGVHRTTQTLTEFVQDRKVVWHVTDSWIGFAKDTSEWDGTDVVFDVLDKGGKTEVRFTHVGLVPGIECYDACSGGWSSYLAGSLRDLITTGKGDPYTGEGGFDEELAKHDAVNKPASV